MTTPEEIAKLKKDMRRDTQYHLKAMRAAGFKSEFESSGHAIWTAPDGRKMNYKAACALLNQAEAPRPPADATAALILRLCQALESHLNKQRFSAMTEDKLAYRAGVEWLGKQKF